MSFTQWLFLLGSAGVVGPLIAHLLARPRFKKVSFTMLRFLRSGQIESRSRRKFRDLLILLLRCVIIILIAMMFSRPMLLSNQISEQPEAVYYLGLDNSMSMAYTDGSETYFDKMIQTAAEYIRSADDKSVINICDLASGQWQQCLSKDAALAALKQRSISPHTANLDEFISVIRSAREGKYRDVPVSTVIVSDFSPAIIDQFESIKDPVALDAVDALPIVSSQLISNLAIINAHAGSIDGGRLAINATVINYGQVEQSRRLIAKFNGKQSDPVKVFVGAGQRRATTLEIEFGSRADDIFVPIELILSPGDGLKEDDCYNLAVSLSRSQRFNVLLVDSSQEDTFLLKTAFDTLSKMDLYETVNIDRTSYDEFANVDLANVDIIVFSAIKSYLEGRADDLSDFIRRGGRTVFFMTDGYDAKAVKGLWAKGILPARPIKRIVEPTRIKTFSTTTTASDLAPDDSVTRSLLNYGFDTIVLSEHFQFESHPESESSWLLENGDGFFYSKPLGNGTSIIVNTSTDDSLGSLTKSNASLAFCSFLLGHDAQIEEFCFRCDEHIFLPASDMELKFSDRKDFWVYRCDGQKSLASVSGSFLLLDDAAGVGWVKTMTSPTRWAGVNLCAGETNLAKPSGEQIENAISRAFIEESRVNRLSAKMVGQTSHKPLWRYFAWALILLLLVEMTVSNTLKR